MGGFMSGSQFGVKVGWRAGIFLALAIGFPLIVDGLIAAAGTHGVGGASSVFVVVASIYLKPVILLAFLISLLAPCRTRMRSLGLPGFVGFLAPFLILMDWPYWVAAGPHWGVALSLGIWWVNPPQFTLTALAMLVAMTVASSPSDDRSPIERFGVIVWICGILAILLAAVPLASWGSMVWIILARVWFHLPGVRPPPMQLPAIVAYYAVVIKPFICVAFGMAMAALAYLSRKVSSGHSPGDSEPGGGPPVRSPPVPSPNSGAVALGRR